MRSASSMPVIILPASNAPGYPPEAITTHTAGSGDHLKSPSLTRPSTDACSASSRSLSRRIRMGCVSGSPKRQLNSSTCGPLAVIIRPQYRIPVGCSLFTHAVDHGLRNVRQQPVGHLRVENLRRGIGAHAARVRTLVAIEDSLVVLCGHERG